MPVRLSPASIYVKSSNLSDPAKHMFLALTKILQARVFLLTRREASAILNQIVDLGSRRVTTSYQAHLLL